MKLYDFVSRFPDEQSCKDAFRAMRQREGFICPVCGCPVHYWMNGKEMFKCKHCGHMTSLRAGTIMHGSKLPFRWWFITMHLLTATKHTFSAAEIQRQLGAKRYQPIWEMMHKIRTVMGRRDAEYLLSNCIELDEAFFSTEREAEAKGEKLKAGAGSQKKSKVLVMAESEDVECPKKGKKAKKVGRIKMHVIPDTKGETIFRDTWRSVDMDVHVTMDMSSSHGLIEKAYDHRTVKMVTPKDAEENLPWVHTVISNCKSQLLDTYHGTKKEYLQDYLNEFCYKFNRRYLGEGLFDNLLKIVVKYQNRFEHRMYNKPKGMFTYQRTKVYAKAVA